MTIPFKTRVQNLMQYTENVNTESTEDIPLEGLHALIAEDNELNLEIAKLMLEEKGICVECAADGKEAVAKFEESEQGHYDVIFMDIMIAVYEWMGCDKGNPDIAKTGCRQDTNYSHECKCVCRRYH